MVNCDITMTVVHCRYLDTAGCSADSNVLLEVVNTPVSLK
jgi:hypothetical protein